MSCFFWVVLYFRRFLQSNTAALFSNHTVLCIHSGFNNINSTLFTYNERIGHRWESFCEPYHRPLFSFNTNNPVLESVCGNDTFCMFDVASTGRTDIGLSTLNNSREYEEILELLRPSM